MLRRSLLPIIVTACLCSHALAAPLYQVTDEKGHITYTDKPPADSNEGDSKPVDQKPLNVLESQPSDDFQKSFDRHRAKTNEKRESAWEAYDQSLDEARQRLKSAQAALKTGDTIKQGDMIATHNPSGATLMRPTDEYVARQQALKQAVDDAQANLDAVLKNKPALRRN